MSYETKKHYLSTYLHYKLLFNLITIPIYQDYQVNMAVGFYNKAMHTTQHFRNPGAPLKA